MKKSLITLTIMLAAVAMVAAFSCPALAQVSGQCSACHTMHDSQGGTAMATDGPHAALLMNSCVGCHTTPSAAPADPYANATPYVRSTTPTGLNDDVCLAGGFFPQGDMGTGSNDDNHHGIDAAQTNTPAGYDDTWYTGADNGLGCAGSNGCHGNQDDVSDMDAISGGHHNTAQTYRMLYVDTDKVSGSPAEDYEEDVIQNTTAPIYSGAGQNVNIYSAGTCTDATISELCGKCHGNFHGEDIASNTTGTKNTAGEWIRHPSDEPLPTTWTMGGVYAFDGDDAKNNPFGYTDAVYASNPTQATCLSCHRAHGTENADLLRWDYGTQLAGGVSVDYGCLGCHNAQR